MSHTVKDFILKNMEQGIVRVYIDLSECDSMDSTFMGVITGISKSLLNKGSEKLNLINISPHNFKLLDTLGLTVFFNIKESFVYPVSPTWTQVQIERLDKYSVTKHVLESHKTLIDTDLPETKRFEGLKKMLEENLRKQEEEDKGK